jgi:hypothetical protein
MNIKVLGLLTGILLAGPMAAGAQPVVYDYTGVVTSSVLYNSGAASGPFTPVPIGTQVSGTYTLDYSQGQPNGGGKVGSPQWGLYDGTPGSLLFGTTFRAGQVVYSTDNSLPGMSNVSGTSVGPTHFFEAQEAWYKGQQDEGSQFVIVNSHGAYDAEGLPIFAGAQSATGNVSFSLSTNAESAVIDFNLRSLTLAPEIDPASAAGALTLLLSGIAMALGVRRSRSTERTAV